MQRQRRCPKLNASNGSIRIGKIIKRLAMSE
jgi:hypothetical protein